jgi:hypothetical protein
MIDELLKPASDDDLRKFANGDSGIQWYRNIAAELLRRREADRWIPVSKRLPETNENVLVISKKGSQWVAAIDKELGWMDNIEGYIDNDITHWRNLPEPPEAT